MQNSRVGRHEAATIKKVMKAQIPESTITNNTRLLLMDADIIFKPWRAAIMQKHGVTPNALK